MKLFKILSCCLFISVLLISCSGGKWIWSQESRFNRFVQKAYKQVLYRSPEELASLGIDERRSEWNDYSQENLKKENELNEKILNKLLKFNVESFSLKSQLDWKIFKRMLENDLDSYKYRFYFYREHQFFGRHSAINSFLLNEHTIESVRSAKNYIARVRAVKKDLHDLDQHLLLAQEKSIIPPRWVFDKVEKNIVRLLKGAPLDDSGEDHLLVKDFKEKIQSLNLSQKKQEKLVRYLHQALKEFYKPAYEKHLGVWQKIHLTSRTKDGVWQHPGGDDYYTFILKKHTTTDLTPDQIHQMGLKQVRRIHKEMMKIKRKLGFKGSLIEFFNDFRNNKKFYYSNPDQYIKDTHQAFLKAEKLMPDFFNLLPQYSIKIKPVESFRSPFSGSAFYEAPSIDGSRPAIYFVNLYNLREQPKYKLKALSYHETLPGHHLQISISMKSDISEFRRYNSHFTAFLEGWALYAERLAKKMGLYSTLYDEFGRLSMELMRACRLVVDTGLHYKKWSKEKAIEYLVKNSDASYDSSVRSVDRYIVNPGQATAYMIGFLKIMELRKQAEEELKEKFDIKEFHSQVLQNGALPLDLLEEIVFSWIEEIKKNDFIFTSF